MTFETVTPERYKFQEFQLKLKNYLVEDNLIYDIGKNNKYDYSPRFKEYIYKTVDRMMSKEPDIFLDLEYDTIDLPQADAVICNGVTEQCDNPFKVLESLDKMLKNKGYILFGIASVGYPIYDIDYTRFTPNGVRRLLRDYRILEEEIMYRNELPSYILLIVQKR